MRHLRRATTLRSATGAFALAIALVLAGCGQASDGTATLEVASVPKAEVFVDGTSQGTTGSPIQLAAGEHKVEVRLDKFTTFEKTVTLTADETTCIDAVLMPQDPSDPAVIAKLGEAMDVEVAPFVAPRTTRGGRSKRQVAMLLWPSHDVRKAGLVNYAIEADETYGGDATLEFRSGRTVLYREAFKPESVTTVRSIPAEVLESVKVNSKITWGLFFEDKRSSIKASFRVVRRPKAERQLERVRNSRHMQRQPLITRQIMGATILENNRLYTEALVENLKIASSHKDSIQPYRGIVTTLRRLDAEDSELFAFVSPFVSGKGGHAGIARPGASGRDGAGLGIDSWSPVQAAAMPTVADATPSGATNRMGPGGAGVTPADTGTRESDGAEADPATAAPTAQPVPAEPAQVSQLRERSEVADDMSNRAADAARGAQEAATAAEQNADQAEAAAVDAEAAATAAREAVEQAPEPTREQQEAMADSGRAAEEAREAANVAREDAQAAREQADRLSQTAEAAALRAEGLRRQLERIAAPSATDTVPAADAPTAPDPHAAAEAEQANAAARHEAEMVVRQAQTDLDGAQAELEAASQARDDAPGPEAVARFEAASAAVEAAQQALENAQGALDAAQAPAPEVKKNKEKAPKPAGSNKRKSSESPSDG